MSVTKTFSQRLSEEIKNKGYTQAGFAEALNTDIDILIASARSDEEADALEKKRISKDSLKSYLSEANFTNPPLEKIVLIADKLDVSVDYLLGRIDHKSYAAKDYEKLTGLSEEAYRQLTIRHDSEKKWLSFNNLNNMMLFNEFWDMIDTFNLLVHYRILYTAPLLSKDDTWKDSRINNTNIQMLILKCQNKINSLCNQLIEKYQSALVNSLNESFQKEMDKNHIILSFVCHIQFMIFLRKYGMPYFPSENEITEKEIPSEFLSMLSLLKEFEHYPENTISWDWFLEYLEEVHLGIIDVDNENKSPETATFSLF